MDHENSSVPSTLPRRIPGATFRKPAATAGSPRPVERPRDVAIPEDAMRRFWAKVTIDPSGCLLWTAARNRNGYGQFRFAGQTASAYRFAYTALIGPIPEGLHIDHLCRVRHCVNPAHLEPVTQRTNILRGDAPSAQNVAKTHCPQGHPYDGSNLIVEGNRRKYRRCRDCKNAWRRAARAAAKAASA